MYKLQLKGKSRPFLDLYNWPNWNTVIDLFRFSTREKCIDINLPRRAEPRSSKPDCTNAPDLSTYLVVLWRACLFHRFHRGRRESGTGTNRMTRKPAFQMIYDIDTKITRFYTPISSRYSCCNSNKHLAQRQPSYNSEMYCTSFILSCTTLHWHLV